MTDVFDFDAIPPSSKGVYRLVVPAEHDPEELVEAIALVSGDGTSSGSVREAIRSRLRDGELSLPVLAARGPDEGECLVVSAGVHGDEYEGMLAIHRVFDELDPARMRGRLVAVPIVSPPAFWLGVRRSPFDGGNMARVFPGATDGSLTERIAAKILEDVLRHANVYIDLHSAGSHYHMLTLCGYIASGAQAARAREAAERFGAPFIWEHPSVGPGRTLTATLELGIPSLYAETHGGGARAEDVGTYVRGVYKLLKYMELYDLPQSGAAPSRARRLRGAGDLDFAITCSASGLYFASAGVGDNVSRGDLLGVVRDVEGGIVDRVVAPGEGIVVLARATPRVYAGETLAAITAEIEGEDE